MKLKDILKLKFRNKKNLISLILIIVLFLFFFREGGNQQKFTSPEWKQLGKFTVMKGILQSRKVVLCRAKNSGIILEIAKHGGAVKKGDFICRIDDTEAYNRLLDEQLKIKKEKIKIETKKVYKQYVETEANLTLELKERTYQHALLAKKREENLPDPIMKRILEIDFEISKMNWQDSLEEKRRNQLLKEKGFISEIGFAPFVLREKSSKEQVKVLKLQMKIKNKGITKEKIVELEKKVLRAKANRDRADKRLKRLVAKIDSDIQISQLAIKRSKHYIKKHKYEITNAVITAPADGVLLIRTYFDWTSSKRKQLLKPGVQKNSNDVIGEVVDPADMIVKVVVNEADFHLLRKNMPVELTLPAKPNKIFQGKLLRIASLGRERNDMSKLVSHSKNSNISTYEAIISFDTAGNQFQPGMSARVKFIIEKPEKKLVINRSTILKNPDNNDFYVLKKYWSSFEKVKIEGRYIDNFYFEVQKGLEEGDDVLLPNQ